MAYLALANIIGVLHALFVLFVVAGQLLILLGWLCNWRFCRNFSFRVLHLAAIGFVVLESWVGIICPLTFLEAWLRAKSGATAAEGDFIAYWLDRLLYYQAPSWGFTMVYTIFGALVAVTFFAYPPRRK